MISSTNNIFVILIFVSVYLQICTVYTFTLSINLDWIFTFYTPNKFALSVSRDCFSKLHLLSSVHPPPFCPTPLLSQPPLLYQPPPLTASQIISLCGYLITDSIVATRLRRTSRNVFVNNDTILIQNRRRRIISKCTSLTSWFDRAHACDSM